MRDFALLLLAALSGYIGFALLALSQKCHWKAVAGDRALSQSSLISMRGAGGFFLILCVVLANWRDGIAFGSILSLFLLAATGLAVAFTLAWQSVRLRWMLIFVKSRANRETKTRIN